MDHLAHRVAGIFRHTHRVAAFFNLGDIVLYGKYKNKKGKVVAFGQNDKGQPTIEIEPIPKGRKKNKVLGLFKVWSQDRKDQALEKQKQEEKFKSAMADRVASRFLCSQFIGSLVVGAMDAKMEKLLNQLRKSAWGGVSSVKKLKEVLDYLGGWSVEPFVGLVDMNGKYSVSFNDKDRAKVEKVRALAVAAEVGSLPSTPKADTYYTMKVEEITERGGYFDVDFKCWWGCWGFKITSPEGKIFELLPTSFSLEKALGFRNSNMVDLSSPNKLGKRVTKLLRLYDVPGWLQTETKFMDQVNEALGTEAHIPGGAKMRTRENTGSCPCCFRNIKLKATSGEEHPTMVNHGYTRPGWGYIQGNCIGVGFPPFELSPKGTLHLRDEILKPQLANNESYLRKLQSGEVTELKVQRGSYGNVEVYTPEHQSWEIHLRSVVSDYERRVKYLKSDISTLDGLLSGWKPQPLPEPGSENKVWK